MLTFDQIQYFAKNKGININNFRRIITEYLQYEILNSLNKTKESRNLNFIGGTALCLCHHLPRFSEDLDFDNFGLNKKEFIELITHIKRDLELKGFFIEIRVIFKAAYHAHFKFNKILQQYNIKSHREEKILVKFDTVPRKIKIKPDLIAIENYGIAETIRVNPIDILMSQKILTVLHRKQAKGRDYFDVSYLSGLTKPNFKYLAENDKINNMESLKKALLDKVNQVNLKRLTEDVEPFLFKPEEKSRVLLFEEMVKRWE